MATKLKSNGHNGHQLSAKLRKLYKHDKLKVSNAAKVLSHAAKDAKEKFTDVEESVEKYAKANPWKTMGISLLAGVVVGKIFHHHK